MERIQKRSNDTILDNVLWHTQHDAPKTGPVKMPPIEQQWFKQRMQALKMSQRQLAARLNLDHAAVSLMLRGKRTMSMDEAKRLADLLLVPTTEIMRRAGIDVMDDVRKVPIAGYIGPGGVVTLLPNGTHDLVFAPPDVPNGSFALQVRSINDPRDGWLNFVSGTQGEPTNYLDKVCLVALKDGAMMHAVIKRGYKRELFNLLQFIDGNLRVLENKEIAWAARVLWIQPT